MRIRNLIVISNSFVHILDNKTINAIADSLQRINQLFKFNDRVTLELMNEPTMSLRDYPQAEAVAINHAIYVFLNRTRIENISKLITHEYVHVCIAATFSQPCPVWLNEGLAMYISGQNESVVALRPKDIDYFYKMNQRAPYFYNMSIYVVEKLLYTVPLPKVIAHGRECLSFADDSLFGINHIKALLDLVSDV